MRIKRKAFFLKGAEIINLYKLLCMYAYLFFFFLQISFFTLSWWPLAFSMPVQYHISLTPFIPHIYFIYWVEDKLLEWVLIFYHVRPGDWTEVARLGWKRLYPLIHLTGPTHIFVKHEPCVNSLKTRTSFFNQGIWYYQSLRYISFRCLKDKNPRYKVI